MTGADSSPTRLVPVSNLDPVVEALRSGQVVALPTETVYGLAARADLEDAVRAIFRAKNRPADNPLIVHAADAESALGLGRDLRPYARHLAAAFWPGPLSLVLLSDRDWPWVQAGHDTIAVRVPEPTYLRDLIRRVGPLAAPSANLSGRPSPTTAAHCLADLEGRVPLIVDGGSSPGGMESTVVDCTGPEPVILRPGPVTAEDIEAAIRDASAPRNASAVEDGLVARGAGGLGSGGGAAGPAIGPVAASPGTRHPHYRPRARVVLTDDVASRVGQLDEPDRERAMTIGPDPTSARYPRRWATLEELARKLYGWLREADDLGASVIYVERVPEEGLGAALMNRLAKAADSGEGSSEADL